MDDALLIPLEYNTSSYTVVRMALEASLQVYNNILQAHISSLLCHA